MDSKECHCCIYDFRLTILLFLVLDLFAFLENTHAANHFLLYFPVASLMSIGDFCTIIRTLEFTAQSLLSDTFPHHAIVSISVLSQCNDVLCLPIWYTFRARLRDWRRQHGNCNIGFGGHVSAEQAVHLHLVAMVATIAVSYRACMCFETSGRNLPSHCKASIDARIESWS